MLLGCFSALLVMFGLLVVIGVAMTEPSGAMLGGIIIAAICWYSWASVKRNQRRGKGVWAGADNPVAGRSTPTLINDNPQPEQPPQHYTYDALDELDDELE